MEKKVLTQSIQNPAFSCFKRVEADVVNNPENNPAVHKLLSSKCKSGECYALEYPCKLG